MVEKVLWKVGLDVGYLDFEERVVMCIGESDDQKLERCGLYLGRHPFWTKPWF